LKNEAEAYANDIIPKARGAAATILETAEGYKESIIATSKGESSRFLQILEEYNRAPEVTRERLYIETMEQVLSRSTKLVIDQGSEGNSVMYLPLDQLIRRQQEEVVGDYSTNYNSGAVSQGSTNQRSSTQSRDLNRSGREE